MKFKRLLSGLLVTAAALSLTACGGSGSDSGSADSASTESSGD